MVLTINLFLAGFGGQTLPSNLQNFITDENITANTVTNPDYSVNTDPYSVPTQTQLANQNDPFGSTVTGIIRNSYGLIQTILFGITIFSIAMGAPQGFLLAIIIPINIIFIFYLATFIANYAGGLLRGILGWA